MRWPEVLADADTYFHAIGFIAGALVVATFYMKAMKPLRYVAISSNFAFLTYGIIGGLHEIYILHAILLPLNIYRLWQAKKLTRDAAVASQGNLEVDDRLLPFMTKRRAAIGEPLFRKGDAANDMYYVVRGRIYLPEMGVHLGAGDMIGVIGLFSPNQKRLSSAECATECELVEVNRMKLLELYCEDPKLGLYLLQLITGRVIEDVTRFEGVQLDTPESLADYGMA